MELKGLKVAVLSGGRSAEREVSLKSGERVMEALKELGCDAVQVDPSAEYVSEPDAESPCELGKLRIGRAGASDLCEFTASSLEICRRSDVVFMALHGGAGENGMICAVLECNGIRHTGSDFRGLCLAMDKVISKRLMQSAGLLTPEFFVCEDTNAFDAVKLRELPRLLDFPWVIKPVDGGSSLGVKMVDSPNQLRELLVREPLCLRNGLVERRIKGREFTVGVLNGKALAVTEIIPLSGFYDYRNKYVKGRTQEITPAIISEKLTEKLKDAAIRAHNVLFLGAYSRVDMILEEGTERIYLLEVNALPGMTETSLLPQGAAACGISFARLCACMIESAI